MATATKAVTYTPAEVPVDQVPVLWHFVLNDTAGNVAKPEQTFPAPPASVTFTGIANGTFVIVGGQRNAAGQEVGTPVSSAPFTVVDTVLVQLISAIG